MRPTVGKAGSLRGSAVWWISQLDEEAREARQAYEALDDDEITDLVTREPEYYVPRLKALGLKWPR
jgi:hypothetical protein